MRLQIIQDAQGNNTGVFIPISDWELIKTNYPNIDSLDADIPDWQKQILNKRLEFIAKNPDSLKSIDDFFDELDA